MVINTRGIEVRNREIWNIRQPAYIKSSYKLVIHTIRKQGDNLMFFIVPLGSGLKIKMSFCGVIFADADHYHVPSKQQVAWRCAPPKC